MQQMSEDDGGRPDSRKLTSTRATIGSQAGLVMCGLSFTGSSVISIIMGIWMTCSNVHKAVTYLPVAAVVTRVEGTEETADTARVTYSYRVDRQQYVGSGSAKEDDRSKFESLRQYKAGQTVTVFFDPGNPGKSELYLNIDASFGLAFVTMALPFLAIGVNLLSRSFTGKDLIPSKAINAQSNPIPEEGMPLPGGGMFFVFIGTCFAGVAAQLALRSALSWQWALTAGLAILFAAIPAINVMAYKLIARSRAKRAVADATSEDPQGQLGSAKSADLSGQIGSLGKQLALLVGVTLFWCGLTGYFCYLAISPMAKSHYAKLHFATTEGTILVSKMRESSEGHHTLYSPEIKYCYVVGDKRYISDQYDFALRFSNHDFDRAYRIVGQNPVGRHVTVYYNPADPSEAILSLDVASSYLLLLFLQIFVVVAFFLIGQCITLPASYSRLRKFLQETPVSPWRIPRWGIMYQQPDGWEICSRSSRLAPLGHLAVGYAATCCLSIFIIVPCFGGFSDPNPSAMHVALMIAVAIGLAAMVRKFLRRNRGSRVMIDTRRRTLCVHSRKRDMTVSLDKVNCLRVREVLYPSGMTVNNDRVQYLLIEAELSDGSSIPLHAFMRPNSLPGRKQAIAAKVQQAMAEIAGVHASENIETPHQDEAPDVSDPISAVVQTAKAFRRQLRRERYDDLV